MGWEPVELAAPLLENASETALRNKSAAIENAFLTAPGSLQRFPGLKRFSELDGVDPVFLFEHRGDMVGATRGGQVYKVDQAGTAVNATEAAVTGGRRVIFAKTEFELLMAAGGPIIRLRGEKTEILSKQAPDSTHICVVAGRVVAIEPRSGRFRHTPVGQYEVWNPLDTFSAEGNPDNLVAAIVSKHQELLLVGTESIEQFDESPSGSKPFFKRWSIGDGIYAPYTLTATQEGVWGINSDQVWVRFAGQVSEANSDAVQSSLEKIDDWSEAWSAPLKISGQSFFVIQAPRATNRYGTQGITLLYDQTKRRWSTLWGWDAKTGAPARWPGWSILSLWGRRFVGGEGVIYELDDKTYTNDGGVQRWLWRSGAVSRAGGGLWVNKARLRLKRGEAATNADAARVRMRANRDENGWSGWSTKSLGLAGQGTPVVQFGNFGQANSFQFEIEITDAGPVEILSLEIDVIPVRL